MCKLQVDSRGEKIGNYREGRYWERDKKGQLGGSGDTRSRMTNKCRRNEGNGSWVGSWVAGACFFEKHNQILIILPRNLNNYCDENDPNNFINLVSKLQARFDKQINALHFAII